MTLKQSGDSRGLTRERIRQIQNEALERLKKELRTMLIDHREWIEDFFSEIKAKNEVNHRPTVYRHRVVYEGERGQDSRSCFTERLEVQRR